MGAESAELKDKQKLVAVNIARAIQLAYVWVWASGSGGLPGTTTLSVTGRGLGSSVLPGPSSQCKYQETSIKCSNLQAGMAPGPYLGHLP